MKPRTKIVVFSLLAIVIILCARFFPLNLWLNDFLVWVRGLGTFGVLFYFLAYVVGTVVFVPGTALTLGSGLLFGVLWGTILVSLASVLGATFAFLIARSFARGWVAKKVSKYPKFELIDRAIAKNG